VSAGLTDEHCFLSLWSLFVETPVPSHADMYRNFAKFGHVVFEMFELTDKQPDKETYVSRLGLTVIWTTKLCRSVMSS